MAETILKAEGKVLHVERVFDAPRGKVWEAWTNPEILAKWWGPRGWETTIKAFDFKPGGVWHYCMKCVDADQGEFYGMESWGLATFRDIQAPDKFTYNDNFADADGNVNTEMPSFDITMVFEETPDGKTRLVSDSELASEEDLKKLVETGMEQGLKETWDRLAETVEKA
jgi:uncharacterized protein YndB with AHSA1/START domain